MRIFAAIYLLGLFYWPASNAVSQTPKQQPSSATGHKNSKAYQYRNSKYGFTFLLPVTWKGGQIVEDTWSGNTETERGEETVERGPAIRIVNPRSKESDQYGDIYIMILTHKQWDSLQEGRFVVSAAPIGPGELGRNAKYVFAEPPRMINPDLGGSGEIESIMKGNPLHAF
jgi:hypothetical protein